MDEERLGVDASVLRSPSSNTDEASLMTFVSLLKRKVELMESGQPPYQVLQQVLEPQEKFTSSLRELIIQQDKTNTVIKGLEDQLHSFEAFRSLNSSISSKNFPPSLSASADFSLGGDDVALYRQTPEAAGEEGPQAREVRPPSQKSAPGDDGHRSEAAANPLSNKTPEGVIRATNTEAWQDLQKVHRILTAMLERSTIKRSGDGADVERGSGLPMGYQELLTGGNNGDKVGLRPGDCHSPSSGVESSPTDIGDDVAASSCASPDAAAHRSYSRNHPGLYEQQSKSERAGCHTLERSRAANRSRPVKSDRSPVFSSSGGGRRDSEAPVVPAIVVHRDDKEIFSQSSPIGEPHRSSPVSTTRRDSAYDTVSASQSPPSTAAEAATSAIDHAAHGNRRRASPKTGVRYSQPTTSEDSETTEQSGESTPRNTTEGQTSSTATGGETTSINATEEELTPRNTEQDGRAGVKGSTESSQAERCAPAGLLSQGNGRQQKMSKKKARDRSRSSNRSKDMDTLSNTSSMSGPHAAEHVALKAEKVNLPNPEAASVGFELSPPGSIPGGSTSGQSDDDHVESFERWLDHLDIPPSNAGEVGDIGPADLIQWLTSTADTSLTGIHHHSNGDHQRGSAASSALDSPGGEIASSFMRTRGGLDASSDEVITALENIAKRGDLVQNVLTSSRQREVMILRKLKDRNDLVLSYHSTMEEVCRTLARSYEESRFLEQKLTEQNALLESQAEEQKRTESEMSRAVSDIESKLTCLSEENERVRRERDRLEADGRVAARREGEAREEVGKLTAKLRSLEGERAGLEAVARERRLGDEGVVMELSDQMDGYERALARAKAESVRLAEAKYEAEKIASALTTKNAVLEKKTLEQIERVSRLETELREGRGRRSASLSPTRSVPPLLGLPSPGDDSSYDKSFSHGGNSGNFGVISPSSSTRSTSALGRYDEVLQRQLGKRKQNELLSSGGDDEVVRELKRKHGVAVSDWERERDSFQARNVSLEEELLSLHKTVEKLRIERDQALAAAEFASSSAKAARMAQSHSADPGTSSLYVTSRPSLSLRDLDPPVKVKVDMRDAECNTDVELLFGGGSGNGAKFSPRYVRELSSVEQRSIERERDVGELQRRLVAACSDRAELEAKFQSVNTRYSQKILEMGRLTERSERGERLAREEADLLRGRTERMEMEARGRGSADDSRLKDENRLLKEEALAAAERTLKLEMALRDHKRAQQNQGETIDLLEVSIGDSAHTTSRLFDSKFVDPRVMDLRRSYEETERELTNLQKTVKDNLDHSRVSCQELSSLVSQTTAKSLSKPALSGPNIHLCLASSHNSGNPTSSSRVTFGETGHSAVTKRFVTTAGLSSADETSDEEYAAGYSDSYGESETDVDYINLIRGELSRLNGVTPVNSSRSRSASGLLGASFARQPVGSEMRKTSTPVSGYRRERSADDAPFTWNKPKDYIEVSPPLHISQSERPVTLHVHEEPTKSHKQAVTFTTPSSSGDRLNLAKKNKGTRPSVHNQPIGAKRKVTGGRPMARTGRVSDQSENPSWEKPIRHFAAHPSSGRYSAVLPEPRR